MDFIIVLESILSGILVIFDELSLSSLFARIVSSHGRVSGTCVGLGFKVLRIDRQHVDLKAAATTEAPPNSIIYSGSYATSVLRSFFFWYIFPLNPSLSVSSYLISFFFFFSQGMKTLISTIIKSMEHTLSILNVQLMLIFVCASFSYVYWANTLEYRCMDIDVSHTHTHQCQSDVSPDSRDEIPLTPPFAPLPTLRRLASSTRPRSRGASLPSRTFATAGQWPRATRAADARTRKSARDTTTIRECASPASLFSVAEGILFQS